MVSLGVSDIIAAGSLLVAIAALVRSSVSDKKLKRLDLELKEKELQHHKANEEETMMADVEVEVLETGPKKANILRFYNKGEAPAMNVMFKIPSDDEFNEIALMMSPDYLPYPKLLSFQKFEVPFYNSSDKPHQTIVITWDDDYAKGRTKEMVVDM